MVLDVVKQRLTDDNDKRIAKYALFSVNHMAFCLSTNMLFLYLGNFYKFCFLIFQVWLIENGDIDIGHKIFVGCNYDFGLNEGFLDRKLYLTLSCVLDRFPLEGKRHCLHPSVSFSFSSNQILCYGWIGSQSYNFVIVNGTIWNSEASWLIASTEDKKCRNILLHRPLFHFICVSNYEDTFIFLEKQICGCVYINSSV